MLMPENETAWMIWLKYGWALVDWAWGRFSPVEAIAVISTLGVDDVEEELFKVSLIAKAYLIEAKRRKNGE